MRVFFSLKIRTSPSSLTHVHSHPTPVNYMSGVHIWTRKNRINPAFLIVHGKCNLFFYKLLPCPCDHLRRPSCWVSVSDPRGGCPTSISTRMEQTSIIHQNFTVTFLSLYRHNPESFPFASLLS